MNQAELKEFLDIKARQYEHPRFIQDDPIAIPHGFQKKEDIEISGFLTAIIAWGNRKSILNSAHTMMDMMDRAPYEFVMTSEAADRARLKNFVHRTFNGGDLNYFIEALREIYTAHGGLEEVMGSHCTARSTQPAITVLKKLFFHLPHPQRIQKHLADPEKGSAAKRINMFLRWMVRPADAGVDFGIWTRIQPAQLSCPLDVHSGNVARKLGLLKRKQNDARAVAELDGALRVLDVTDPVRYDFALFGLGVFEKF